MTPQDIANFKLSHFQLAKRRHPKNHAKRIAVMDHLDRQMLSSPVEYEATMRRLQEAMDEDA